MEEKIAFSKSKLLSDKNFHYCPGCTHGIVHRLIAESLDELGVKKEDIIGIAPVGCAVFVYNYFECDFIQAAHGRAPAVATAAKRVHPDKVVFSYQGDGDLISIGAAETIHAAARNENITVIFINNCIYGMTGGQMAPTTLIGQKSTTTQHGREVGASGYPIHTSEMLAQLQGSQYIERVSTHDAANVLKAKKAIKKAFDYQLKGKGFSIVEVLTSCPTNWKMSTTQSLQFMKEQVVPFYPLGVFKDRG